MTKGELSEILADLIADEYATELECPQDQDLARACEHRRQAYRWVALRVGVDIYKLFRRARQILQERSTAASKGGA